MEKFGISSIPHEKKSGWATEVKFDENGRVSLFSAKSQFGVLTYGQRPEGYDSWVYEETGGGGAVTLPFFKKDGKLYVGLLRENRANMGGEALCIMGGFVDPGESHGQAQVRESSEESDLKTEKATELPGLPMNSNRAFFVADPNKGEGIHAYAFRVAANTVEEKEGKFVLKDEYLSLHPKAKNLVFMPWQEAVVKSADVIAIATIARFVATII